MTVPLTCRPSDWVWVESAGEARVVLLVPVKLPPAMMVVTYGAPDVSGVPSLLTP